MSDKLDWINKHFVLLKYLTIEETANAEQYKIRPDLAEYVPQNNNSSEFIWNLKSNGKFKEACDFLAYAMHHRACVWWGYCCLLDLLEELKENPVKERDIADIGAPKEVVLPDWAKDPGDPAAKAAENAKGMEQAKLAQEEIEKTIAALKKDIPPDVQKMTDELIDIVNDAFMKVHGISIDDLLKKAAEVSARPLFEIDPESPIFKEEVALKEKIEKMRKETVDLIKSVLPPKVPEHDLKIKNDAMMAVYQWVLAPDEKNTQYAMDCGNACPDKPYGMLALSAFWSYGNLQPTGKQVIITPAGLAANGICSTLLLAALHPGGTRKYAERCERYLEIGIQVAIGQNNWGENVEDIQTPHEKILDKNNINEEKISSEYKKWSFKSPQNLKL